MDKRNYFISQSFAFECSPLTWNMGCTQNTTTLTHGTEQRMRQFKNEQLTELICISTSGMAVTLGQAKSWDHSCGLKSLPNFWHLLLSLNKALFFCFSLSIVFHSGYRGVFLLESVWLLSVFYLVLLLGTKGDCILFSHPRCMYPSASQATFSCTSNLIGEVCGAMQRQLHGPFKLYTHTFTSRLQCPAPHLYVHVSSLLPMSSYSRGCVGYQGYTIVMPYQTIPVQQLEKEDKNKPKAPVSFDLPCRELAVEKYLEPKAR